MSESETAASIPLNAWRKEMADGYVAAVWNNFPYGWQAYALAPRGVAASGFGAKWKWLAKIYAFEMVRRLRQSAQT